MEFEIEKKLRDFLTDFIAEPETEAIDLGNLMEDVTTFHTIEGGIDMGKMLGNDVEKVEGGMLEKGTEQGSSQEEPDNNDSNYKPTIETKTLGGMILEPLKSKIIGDQRTEETQEIEGGSPDQEPQGTSDQTEERTEETSESKPDQTQEERTEQTPDQETQEEPSEQSSSDSEDELQGGLDLTESESESIDEMDSDLEGGLDEDLEGGGIDDDIEIINIEEFQKLQKEKKEQKLIGGSSRKRPLMKYSNMYPFVLEY